MGVPLWMQCDSEKRTKNGEMCMAEPGIGVMFALASYLLIAFSSMATMQAIL